MEGAVKRKPFAAEPRARPSHRRPVVYLGVCVAALIAVVVMAVKLTPAPSVQADPMYRCVQTKLVNLGKCS